MLILRGTKDELVDDKTCETYMECYTGAKKFVKIEGAIIILQVFRQEKRVRQKL